MFGNGRITEEMEHIIRRHVQGKEAWDLGAGNDCRWSHLLLEWGVKKLTIVEKEEFVPPASCHVTCHKAYFQDISPPTGGTTSRGCRGP